MSKDDRNHGHSHAGHQHGASGNLKVAFLLNFGFTLLEIAGGLWTNSVAILADAVHDSGDTASLGISWYLQRLSQKESDATFTYGYRRFSTLGALITGLVLLGGLAYILWQAVPRLLNPEAVNAPGMIALAVVGIAVNGAAVLRLRGGTSLNESVVSWHLLEDTLGWVAVLLGSIAMTIWQVPILDPILSIFIALFVLWNIIRQLRQVLLVFLQRAPKSFDMEQFTQRVTILPNVLSTHHVHSWTMDGEHHVFSTHVVVNDGATRDDIVAVKQGIRDVLKEHEFEHMTVEIELAGEDCPVEQEQHE